MSRSIRVLLILSCLLLSLAPASLSAGSSGPMDRPYGPESRLHSQVSPAALAGQAAAEALASGLAAPAAAQPVDAWSRIAYESFSDGNWEIFSMRPDGSDVRRLTAHPADDALPRQSPANGRIAFTSDRGGNYDIYSMAADGSDLRQLTSDPATDTEPAWSPDGKQIAFSSKRGGNWDVFVMNADGSNLIRFTADPAAEFGPAWSPDGRSIAWVRSTGAEMGKIWVASADGSNARAVSDDMRFAEKLAWSPDGRRILFSSDWGWIDFLSITSVASDGSFPSAELIHSPHAPMTDVLMGGYAPDGSAFIFAEVTYTVQSGNLYIDHSTILRQNTVCCDGPSAVPGSGLDMAPDWQKTDFTPPVSRLAPPPALASSTNGITLSWSGSDAGGSGLLNYDLQYRVNGGQWADFYGQPLTETTYGAAFSSGQVVSFRVRARDAAGNVEPWPAAANGEGTTTFYQTRFYGRLFDLRETPIPGVRITGPNWPDIPFVTDASGRYDAYSFNDIYTLGASDPAYGVLTNARVGGGELFDLALPPKVNAVQNGGFEDGLTGWELSQPSAAELAFEAHAGDHGLRLGNWSAQSGTSSVGQALMVPPASGKPTLSFFMRRDVVTLPITNLTATITPEGGAAARLTLHPSAAGIWTHAWADLTEWGGQRVTLGFEVTQKGGDTLILDEVSVGEWHTPRITSVQGPAGMTGAITVLGENFEPGAAIRLDDADLATTYVSGAELTAALPADVKPGLRSIWVQNPGGEEALASLRVGLSIHLPVINRGD